MDPREKFNKILKKKKPEQRIIIDLGMREEDYSYLKEQYEQDKEARKRIKSFKGLDWKEGWTFERELLKQIEDLFIGLIIRGKNGYINKWLFEIGQEENLFIMLDVDGDFEMAKKYLSKVDSIIINPYVMKSSHIEELLKKSITENKTIF